jgi:hypothetical protein
MFHVAKTDKICVSNENINFNCLQQYNPLFYNHWDSLKIFSATLSGFTYAIWMSGTFYQ